MDSSEIKKSIICSVLLFNFLISATPREVIDLIIGIMLPVMDALSRKLSMTYSTMLISFS
jgi:hypothetical protein